MVCSERDMAGSGNIELSTFLPDNEPETLRSRIPFNVFGNNTYHLIREFAGPRQSLWL
jgi:hypothetical protein